MAGIATCSVGSQARRGVTVRYVRRAATGRVPCFRARRCRGGGVTPASPIRASPIRGCSGPDPAAGQAKPRPAYVLLAVLYVGGTLPVRLHPVATEMPAGG